MKCVEEHCVLLRAALLTAMVVLTSAPQTTAAQDMPRNARQAAEGYWVDGMVEAARGPFLQKTLESGGGSNTWSIAARHSESGHAVHCNDMHLALSTPGKWYLVHLNAGSSSELLHSIGASLPGSPYVMVGHNSHIAWGMTLAFTDCEDLFVEKLDPDNPRRYLYKNEW